MKKLAEKVLYCLRMMSLSDWLTQFVSDDYQERVLARHILIYLDSFIELASQLKNKIKKTGVNVNSVKQKLNQLRQDYEDFYSKIRDKLAAHRQDLPLVQRIEAWNEIDNTEDEFREVRNKIAAHVDSKEVLNVLLALLDSKDIKQLIDKVFDPAYKAFRDWCQSDIATQVFLVHLDPEIKNVTEIEDLGGYKPYD